MPEDGKRPRRGSDDTERKDKKLWIFLPILLVFVSITSFIAGTRIGRDTEYHLGQMLDTIVLSPDEERVDETHVDLSGQIHNPDGSPRAGQLVELHSDPMRTRTDSDGIFYFPGVEVGEHHLILLDEEEQEISQIAVRIERDSTISFGAVESSTKSIHLGLPDRAVGLHIHIRLDEENRMYVEPEVFTRIAGDTFRDIEGNEVSVDGKTGNRGTEEPVPESGEGLVDQDNIRDESRMENQQESLQAESGESGSSGQTDIPSGSSQAGSQESTSAAAESTLGLPESTEGATQESSAQESVPGPGTSGGAGSDSGGSDSGSSGMRPTRPTNPTDPANPSDVSVQEKGGPVWTQNTIISLFADRTGAGTERKLMPGSKGSYGFYVSNPKSYQITYRMRISAPGGQLLLPLRYRLKSDGKYLCGDSKTWLTADQLATASVELDPGTEKEYLLEWQWLFEGGDDAYDTRIGSSENLEYQVIVTIAIEQVIS